MGSLDIAIVSSWMGHVRGGAEVNDLRLGTALEGLGHDVVYYTFVDDEEDAEPLPRQSQTVWAPYLLEWSYSVPWPFGKFIRHLNTTVFIRRLVAAEFEHLHEADLVLTTGRPQLALLGRHLRGTHFHAVRSSVNPLYSRYLQRTDGLVFWGGVREEFDREPVLTKPHVPLNPAVDAEPFGPDPSPSLRADLQGGNSETAVLTFVGRLVDVKQVDIIIEAVANLRREIDRPVKLVIVGDGQKRASLESLADDRLAEREVCFTGQIPREEVATYLNASDVFVMASATENHPIALKEALTCGTYCVAPTVGRIPELLDTGVVGTTYAPPSVETLTETLGRVFEEERPSAVPRAERATEYNTWEDNAEEIVELYETA